MSETGFRKGFWKPVGAGFLVLLPIGLVLMVLIVLFRFTDGILSPLIHSLIHAAGRFLNIPFLETLFIPGLGLAVLVFLVYGTGVLSLSRLGKWVIRKGESAFEKVPMIGNIYTGAQVLVRALMKSDSKKEGMPVLAEIQPGQHVVGFQTGKTTISGRPMIAVYVPTTPNPTSGTLMFLRADQVVSLDLPMDETMKLVLSGGLTVPHMLR